MQNNKYIASAPTMQATQQQRMAQVNQGVRANLINFQGAPPSAPKPASKVVKADGEQTKIERAKEFVGKWGFLAVTFGIIAASHIKGENKPAPVVVQKGRFGKK